MADKKSQDNSNTGSKPAFSRRFDNAMIETRMIDAIVQSDGWTLAEFTNAPPWLRQVYSRHAAAAFQEMQNIERTENDPKPPEHE